MEEKKEGLTRRDFAKAAALTTAAAIVPAELLAQQERAAPEAAKSQAAPEAPKLNADSQAEADLAYETIMRKYGSRFTAEQKTEIKRLLYQQQSGLDKIRTYEVKNSDAPATAFRPLVPEVKR